MEIFPINVEIQLLTDDRFKKVLVPDFNGEGTRMLVLKKI